MRFTIPTVISAFAAYAAAYTPANTADPPSGNPIIHPGSNELIPAGEPYTITWKPTPTISGRVSLILLRGPASNVVPIMTIADSIANSGSYTWDVPSSLEPDTAGYGIQLVVEGTGQYQYSTQCGVSNAAYGGSSSSLSSHAMSSTTAASSDSSSTSSTSRGGSLMTSTSVTVIMASGSMSSFTSTSYITYATGAAAGATGSSNFNSPILSPTKSMTVPATLKSTAVASASASSMATSSSNTASKLPSGMPSAQATAGAVPGAVARGAGSMFVAAFAGLLAL